MISNWVRQLTTTTGTGQILLSSPVAGYIPFSSAFSDGAQLFYSVTDGSNREIGVGIYSSQSNTITRTYVLETLFQGTYNKGRAIPPISLSGSAYVAVMPSTYSVAHSDPIWKEMLPSSGLTLLNTSPPDEDVFIGNIRAYTFPVGRLAEIGFTFHIPHDVSRTAPLIPFVSWAPLSVDTGNIRWGFEYSLAARDAEFGASTDVGIIGAASGVLNQVHHHEVFEGDRIPAQTPGTIFAVRVYRDSAHGQDTFTGSAALFGFGMHYQSDRRGTPQRDHDFYSWT